MNAILKDMGVWLLSAPIWGYRLFVSPFLPPSCRFTPSCSEYALDALKMHGPFKGSALAIRRLSRCHPIKFLGGSSGFDPVPPISHSGDADCGCHGAENHGPAVSPVSKSN